MGCCGMQTWWKTTPDFPKGITGTRLVNLFIRQAQNLHIEVIHEQVLDLAYEHDLFQAQNCAKHLSIVVAVIATGTKPCRIKDHCDTRGSYG